jgi:AraC-like DNA-binding protein
LQWDNVLERLCASMTTSQITSGPANDGIERMSARFRGFSFSPHRHDTYAIGITTHGVQAFTYRGVAHQSLPGQAFVLHPDERHDGCAGDARGFAYCIAYIDPALILMACQGKGLPFLGEPLTADRQLYEAISEILRAADEPMGLTTTCNITALSDALWRLAGSPCAPNQSLDLKGVRAARDALISSVDAKVSISELERISGMSRWQFARQFRRAYGVSPSRFHLLRRLAHARNLLQGGQSLAEISDICGFADQPHLSRKFKSAFGASPGQWRALTSGHAGLLS